ncbi:MAG: hypothetical protein KAX69_01605 [Chitinophagales bacterium]|nr:hypothetical protein [Chitinophagales bacterium]
MKISALKHHLNSVTELNFKLPDGSSIPAHFHLTEIGLITKHFVDCGVSIHLDKWASLQIWVANDTDHRLQPEKFLKIIDNSEKIIGTQDLEVEVEYQSDTIGRYGLEFDGVNFMLTPKQTACLAMEKCGIPQEKPKVLMSELSNTNQSCCTPGGGCC